MIIDIGQVYEILVCLEFDEGQWPARFGHYAPGSFYKWRSLADMVRNKDIRRELLLAVEDALVLCCTEHEAVDDGPYPFAYTLEHVKEVGWARHTRVPTTLFNISFDLRFEQGKVIATVCDIYPKADSRRQRIPARDCPTAA